MKQITVAGRGRTEEEGLGPYLNHTPLPHSRESRGRGGDTEDDTTTTFLLLFFLVLLSVKEGHTEEGRSSVRRETCLQ